MSFCAQEHESLSPSAAPTMPSGTRLLIPLFYNCSIQMLAICETILRNVKSLFCIIILSVTGHSCSIVHDQLSADQVSCVSDPGRPSTPVLWPALSGKWDSTVSSSLSDSAPVPFQEMQLSPFTTWEELSRRTTIQCAVFCVV